MPPTIKDIAKKAGVSVTTVSKALNNYQDIKPETRKKILKIARELNYQPNTTARNLVLRKTNTIGLIISGLSTSRSAHHFLFDVICGINDQAYGKQYDVLLYGTNSENQKRMSYLDLCLQRNFDGVILMGVKTDDPYVQEVVEAEIPTVLIDVPIVTSTCGYVTTDNVKGAEMAVQHLLDLGHRHILMINGHRQAFVSLQREEGYKKALEANGLPFREDYVAYTDFESDSGAQAVVSLLQKHLQATAIFCASDLIAYGVITKCMEMGYRVPEDISVIGFDGIQLGEIMTPALSTIYQNRYVMGTSAVNMLIEMLEGSEGYSRVLPPTLIQRDSTKAITN
ncbi:transcriptional regulator, LacI family [Caldalkalibacillus thermarum TA2.A1]|uniref:LacI family transcriptional regulator n=1 Tax=Caldalkalibacillus thermarum (strain TA2.A1) TaxID=986075 RepID=F5L3Y9_CALTT|nr:LacI family DNA-binding transcriptional regulator [Caldalkalibacillus thermarum]EGL83951.1 transcriptional regulator, LacI family [Caldalkalibacillus thermarum TA2.A1]QZT32584.1 LacI family transcriptional regulator [Caldalkalibacillus thermarum TA2.A1]